MNGFKFMFEGVVDCSRFGTIGGGHTIRLASIAPPFSHMGFCGGTRCQPGGVCEVRRDRPYRLDLIGDTRGSAGQIDQGSSRTELWRRFARRRGRAML